VLEEGGWSLSLPGRFPLGRKPCYPLYSSLDGPQGRFRRLWRREVAIPSLLYHPPLTCILGKGNYIPRPSMLLTTGCNQQIEKDHLLSKKLINPEA
jgi:hypothetical protein